MKIIYRRLRRLKKLSSYKKISRISLLDIFINKSLPDFKYRDLKFSNKIQLMLWNFLIPKILKKISREEFLKKSDTYIIYSHNLKANTYFFCFPGNKKKCLSPTSNSHSYRVSRVKFDSRHRVCFWMRLTNRNWRIDSRVSMGQESDREGSTRCPFSIFRFRVVGRKWCEHYL